MINVATNLERNAALLPSKTALIFGDQQFTYAELNAAANKVANVLDSLGIGKGDRVVLACPNIPWFPIIYYGVLKAGAVVVPINVLLKAPEIAYLLQDSQARAFFCFEGSPALPLGVEGHAGFLEAGSCPHFIVITADPSGRAAIEGAQTFGMLIRNASPVAAAAVTDANDTAAILYTSGTTGKPKGAELTHANIAMNMMACLGLMQHRADDTQLVVLPLFHSFGQVVQMNTCLMAGGTMVLLARFDPDMVFRAMQKHGVTIFAGVPTMFIGLLNLPEGAEPHDFQAIAAKLRLGVSGGAAMPVEVIKRFEEKFGIAILEGYGLSETSPVATFTFLDDTRMPGSVGKPIWGVEVRVLDGDGTPLAAGEDGEIVIRGHNLMKGYFNRPEATAEAIRGGWFHSGDIGHFDAQGNLFIVDRMTDLIIRGGFNVYPREVEEVLITHAAVAQVAVIGVPHATHGEEVKAVVTLRPGVTVTAETLKAWCEERMAAYKYPRIVEIVDALPMTATGKILKRALKASH